MTLQEDEKAKLLLSGACCDNCHYKTRDWEHDKNDPDYVVFRHYCARYTLGSGKIVKLNCFDNKVMKEIDPNEFCDYYVREI